MKSVSQARAILLVIASTLLVIAIAATAWLISPSGRSAAALDREVKDLRAQYQVRIRELGPARDIDKRLAQAREQQAAFYTERLPNRYSTVSETLSNLAVRDRVQISAIKYQAKDTEIFGLQRLGVSAQITGDYANEMRFINALERSKLFFVIERVDLASSEAGKVRLDITLQTYLRSAS